MNNKRSFSASKLFVILSGILIMLTSFISINAISSSQKKQVVGISTTSETSTSSTPTPTASSFSSPTIKPVSSPSSSPIATHQPDQNLFLLYPNAKTTSLNNNQLLQISSDSPKVITDWFKQKLSGLGYSISNFVATSNNDNIENKLQVVGEKKITVEISRRHGESMTNIIVDIN